MIIKCITILHHVLRFNCNNRCEFASTLCKNDKTKLLAKSRSLNINSAVLSSSNEMYMRAICAPWCNIYNIAKICICVTSLKHILVLFLVHLMRAWIWNRALILFALFLINLIILKWIHLVFCHLKKDKNCV